MKMTWRLSGILFASLSLASCTQMKNLEDMHEKTNQMATDTHAMVEKMDKSNANMESTIAKMDTTNATTLELKSLTESMHQTTSNLMDLDRLAGSSEIREKRLEAMRKLPIEQKLTEGGKFNLSWEFQFWGASPHDTPQSRLDLFAFAIQEFFLDLASFFKTETQTSPAWPPSDRMEILCALAATIDQIESHQIAFGKQKNFKPVSLMDLIIDGLTREQAINSGSLKLSSQPQYVQDVNANSTLAVYILQLRANFLSLAAIAKLGGFDDKSRMGLTGKLRALIRRFRPKELNLSDKNLAQIAAETKFLGLANATRQVLKDLGKDSKVDPFVRKLYENTTIAQPSQVSSEKAEAIQAFSDQVKVLLSF